MKNKTLNWLVNNRGYKIVADGYIEKKYEGITVQILHYKRAEYVCIVQHDFDITRQEQIDKLQIAFNNVNRDLKDAINNVR